jgi:hypothetical protein
MTAIPPAERAVRRSGLWMVIGLLLVALVYVRALAFTPEEATQGLAQKIFYRSEEHTSELQSREVS